VVAGSHILLISVHVKKGQCDLTSTMHSRGVQISVAGSPLRLILFFLLSNGYGFSIWNLFRSIVLTPRILRRLLDFWKKVCTYGMWKQEN
jgi:hypothetical protein